MKDPVNALDNLQLHFTNIIKDRIAAGLVKEGEEEVKEEGVPVKEEGVIEIHKDASYTENPMEREDVEDTIKVETMKGLHQLKVR